MYVLVGRDKALVVDTQTMTEFEGKKIVDYVKDITSKPLIVVNTHPHGDHTAANAQFGEVHISAAGMEEIKAGAARRNTPITYTLKAVKEGDLFDLGDRQVEVIAIPAHSTGSIALLDRKAGYLFTGDEIDPGQVVGMNPEKIQLHHANMKKLYDKVLQQDHADRAGAQRRARHQAVHQVLHGPRREDRGWHRNRGADGRRSELRLPSPAQPGALPGELRVGHLHEARDEVGAAKRVVAGRTQWPDRAQLNVTVWECVCVALRGPIRVRGTSVLRRAAGGAGPAERGHYMPRHIGIVACSAEGAALCYRTICVEGAQLLGPHAHPEVSMHTHSLADTWSASIAATGRAWAS